MPFLVNRTANGCCRDNPPVCRGQVGAAFRFLSVNWFGNATLRTKTERPETLISLGLTVLDWCASQVTLGSGLSAMIVGRVPHQLHV